jgi:hypothetical protein
MAREEIIQGGEMERTSAVFICTFIWVLVKMQHCSWNIVALGEPKATEKTMYRSINKDNMFSKGYTIMLLSWFFALIRDLRVELSFAVLVCPVPLFPAA